MFRANEKVRVIGVFQKPVVVVRRLKVGGGDLCFKHNLFHYFRTGHRIFRFIFITKLLPVFYFVFFTASARCAEAFAICDPSDRNYF